MIGIDGHVGFLPHKRKKIEKKRLKLRRIMQFTLLYPNEIRALPNHLGCRVPEWNVMMLNVLSHWLRGRQPAISPEQFQQRWCHGRSL